MARLAGKAAIVTGAGTGIGRATAILFAREGARVAIAEIDAASGEETAHLAGNGAVAIRTDVTDEASLQTAIRTTVQQFGALHILHNNAGGFTPQGHRRGGCADRGVLARHQARPVRHLPRMSRRHTGDHQIRWRLRDQYVLECGADGHCLASDESRMVTGQVYPVDSGVTIS